MTPTLFYVICGYIVLMNLVSFIVYGCDKSRAISNGKSAHLRRTPERTLLALAALGGSFGAIVAVAVFHHKTQHKKFTVLLPIILLLQIIVFFILFLM